jgi:tetratricopeptide (TPR) repeat protein
MANIGAASPPFRPTAFVCYSHQDRDWLEKLLPVFNESAHLVDLWHDGLMKTGTTWYPELKTKLRDSQIAIALLSPNLLHSDFVKNEEIPYILAKFRADGMLFVPFLLWGWDQIRLDDPGSSFWPTELQHAQEHGRSLEDYGDDAMRIVRERFQGALLELSNKPYVLRKLAERTPTRVNIEKLPRYGRECFGRADELTFLDRAWRDNVLNVVAYVAGGGYGKSTLINKWLLRLGQRDWGGAHRVFGWSFYAQGSEADRAYSAQPFVDEALRWFGDDDPKRGSPWDKGERLAKLIGSSRTILVLDGLEPLQWNVGEVRKIKDPALSTLIDGLAARNNGLCIITSRQAVAELADYRSTTTAQRQLDALRAEDGRDLLRANMVLGTDAELLEMSRTVGNHALAVSLLGSWLTRERLPIRETHTPLMATLPHLAGTTSPSDARRVLAGFERALDHTPELGLLRIVGLFDQPCRIDEVQALLAAEPITGITDLFKAAPSDGLQEALGPLRDYKLLTYSPETQLIDAHPIVRDYFTNSFRAELPSSWRKAHAALADIFDRRSIPCPETADEAISLYRSGIHRALSGDLEGAYSHYWSKILQGERYHSHNVLAAYGNDVALLGHLFSQRWNQVAPSLDAALHPKILRDAAVDWQTLGQFELASEAMEASFKTALTRGDLIEASFSASYLSELLVVRGRLSEAVHFGQQAVALGRRSGNRLAYINSLSSAGDALHQTGALHGAYRLFKEGIAHQTALQRDDQWRRHFTLQGYHYCCLQLTRGKPRVVERWCRSQIESGISRSISLLTCALDHIARGRALLALHERGRGTLGPARDSIETGLNLVRQGEDASFLPAGLLARAELLRVEHKLEEASHVLDNVTKIARRGSGMPLYLIDADIERAKLNLLAGRETETQILHSIDRVEASVRLIDYRRRLLDVTSLRKSVGKRSKRSHRWWPFHRS